MSAICTITTAQPLHQPSTANTIGLLTSADRGNSERKLLRTRLDPVLLVLTNMPEDVQQPFQFRTAVTDLVFSENRSWSYFLRSVRQAQPGIRLRQFLRSQSQRR